MTDPLNINPIDDGLTDGGQSITPSFLGGAAVSYDMAVQAAHTACEFFGIPDAPMINSNGTCVWPKNPTTYTDDIFGFDNSELTHLGISGEDSLTLIYTHECAHRTLQGAYNDSWEEELACDFFAGVHAGMKGMNLDNFEASLGSTSGSDTHPNGALRAEFIEFGRQLALEHGDLTYEECIDYLNQHLEDKGGLIVEYRSKFDPNFTGGNNPAPAGNNQALAGNNPGAAKRTCDCRSECEYTTGHRHKYADYGYSG